MQLLLSAHVFRIKRIKKLAGNYSDIHKEIIEASKKGDPKAQFELYKLYSKAMFNICLRMMNSREEAEDLLQEAFTDAFRNLHRFRYESSYGAWLKRIVINKCINAIKSKKAELVLTDEFYGLDSIDDENEDEDIQYDVQRIKNAVEQLPEGYRITFSLYMFEGYDHGEISEILGISESTSKSQYMRAKNKIKEIIRDDKQHLLMANLV